MNERDTTDEPFLERWSRRKAAAREGEVDVDVPDTELGAQPPAQVEPTAPDGEIKLPDLDLLDGDSDYSAFLSPGVDLLLRRRALRKLFHSPKFNVLDGLDDYMGDFTKFEPLGDLVTADMKFQLERAARRVADALTEPDAAPAAVSGPIVVAEAAPPPASDDPTASTQSTDQERAHDDAPERTA